LVILYEWMVDTLSVAVGFALTLGLPLLLTIGIFGRLPRRSVGPAGPA
jgi:hypothetical protein